MKILHSEMNLIILAGHVARMEEGRNDFKILAGKPTKKETFKKAMRRLGGQY